MSIIPKGWLGEKQTQFLLWLGLDKNIYRRCHDVIIPAKSGTTQIDHILVSVYGIFVVETKNMSGWIFGDEKAPQWTQCIYGKKFPFQNPLHQNYRHTRALAELFGLPDDVIHSVVVFIGDCEFKTELPPNVMSRGFCGYIKSFREQLLPSGEVNDIVEDLQTQKKYPFATPSQHVETLKARFNADACPKCGAEMLLRTVQRGANTGSQFYGCAEYPRCRYTRKV